MGFEAHILVKQKVKREKRERVRFGAKRDNLYVAANKFAPNITTWCFSEPFNISEQSLQTENRAQSGHGHPSGKRHYSSWFSTDCANNAGGGGEGQ